MNKNNPASTQCLIHYGLYEEHLRILEECLPNNVILHDAGECATDIIALPSIGVFINPDALGKDGVEMLIDYYMDTWMFLSEVVVFTSKIDALKVPKILYIEHDAFTHKNINTILEEARAKNKRNAGYHARLALCLTILKKIWNNPGISTKMLAEECEVSEKSVLRYIETLRVSGEWIEYDRLSRGWKLHPAFTSFFN